MQQSDREIVQEYFMTDGQITCPWTDFIEGLGANPQQIFSKVLIN